MSSPLPSLLSPLPSPLWEALRWWTPHLELEPWGAAQRLSAFAAATIPCLLSFLFTELILAPFYTTPCFVEATLPFVSLLHLSVLLGGDFGFQSLF